MGSNPTLSASRCHKQLILQKILDRVWLCPSGGPSSFARDLFCGSLSHASACAISTQSKPWRSLSELPGIGAAPQGVAIRRIARRKRPDRWAVGSEPAATRQPEPPGALPAKALKRSVSIEHFDAT